MHSIGIDLGGTFTKLALVGENGQVLGRRKLPAAPELEAGRVFAELRRVLEDLSREAGLPFPPPLGCGVGVPAVVDYRTGWLSFSGALAWRDIPLGETARSALGCEVAVDTDVNAGALADLFFGCARDSAETLYVSWGTGIGAGFAVGRKLYHSRGGAMCNLGHMPADPASRRTCYCGAQGCLEIEAGGRAIVELVRERLRQGENSVLGGVAELTPEAIALAAGRGDRVAREVLSRAAMLMALVLSGVLALLNPETVVFGGGVSRCLPAVREAFDEELRRRAPSFSLPLTKILTSAFGDSAGVVGAAMLPRQG